MTRRILSQPLTAAAACLSALISACGGGDGGAVIPGACSTANQKQFVLDVTRDWYLFQNDLPEPHKENQEFPFEPKDVKAVFINIFGGILRCDVLAEGVIAAVRDLGVKVPIVVRMKGNNEALGKEMLLTSGFAFQTADNMMVAAKKVVASVSAPAFKAKPKTKAKAPVKGGRK